MRLDGEGPSNPEPEFWVLDAKPVARAAAPALSFELRVRDHSEREVYALGLNTQIRIEAAQRAYDEATRERLVELFGEPERWGDTARGVLWAICDSFVPGFTGSTHFELHVPLSLDLEVATVKYFTALDGGDVPLSFYFSGTVFYCGEEDRLQITQISWSEEAQFTLPLETWERTVREHHPHSAFVRLGDDTLEGLRRYRVARGLHSMDATIAALLAEARQEA